MYHVHESLRREYIYIENFPLKVPLKDNTIEFNLGNQAVVSCHFSLPSVSFSYSSPFFSLPAPVAISFLRSPTLSGELLPWSYPFPPEPVCVRAPG